MVFYLKNKKLLNKIMKQLQEFITEEKFGYTWQNAFVCAIKALFDEAGEKKGKAIVNKWFDDKDAAWELYNFLDRLGHTPKSKEPDDLYRAMTTSNDAVIMDDNYNLK